MSGQRRLDKVETTLRPQEAVLVWMAEAHSHRSLFGYVATLRDATDEAFPLVRLGRQMETAVRAAHRGEPEADVWPGVRYAVRDAGFLYFLSANLNARAMEHQRANWLHIALVAEILRTIDEPPAERQRRLGRAHAERIAHTVTVQQGMVDAVAKRYFGGATPLYPDVAADVAQQMEAAETVVELFNDLVWQPEPTRGKRKRVQPPTHPPSRWIRSAYAWRRSQRFRRSWRWWLTSPRRKRGGSLANATRGSGACGATCGRPTGEL